MNTLIELDLVRMGFAAALMLIAIALSAWQKLGLESRLAIAAGRTIVQLIGVGYVIEFVFAVRNAGVVLAIVGVMLAIATIVTRNRISPSLPLLLPWVAGSLLVGTALMLVYVNLLILRPDPWYEPQYLVPLAGIILGNAMNAATIAGERLVKTLSRSQLEIETHLSLGATPQQATELYRREAIQAGLIPSLNTMLVVGIVTLPGIFTGQLLSGVSPLEAALYQIMILFVLAVGSLITTLLLVRGIDRQFFNANAQLVLPQ